jgi:hypothetical protein
MRNLIDFINSEKKRFEPKYNNLFSFTFSEITRYYKYLQVIQERHKIVSKEFVNNLKVMFMQDTFKQGSGIMNEEQRQISEERREITLRLHLEIESFYLFAKILLDKISLAIQFYFGYARSLSLASHDNLTKHVEAYKKARRLSIHQDLVDLIRKLKEDISDFRDYQIQHIPDYRQGRIVRGTNFDIKGNTRISLTSLYPTEKDKQYDSKLLPELMSNIETYITKIIEFIENNKNKTHLPLEVSS